MAAVFAASSFALVLTGSSAAATPSGVFYGSGSTVKSAGLDGSGGATVRSGLQNVQGIAVDGSHVYWGDVVTGNIGEADLNGGNPNDSLISTGGSPGFVLVYGSFIYWSNAGTADIGRANVDGTGVNATFISTAGQAFDLATDGTYLYWNNGRNRIGRATLADPSDANATWFTPAGSGGITGLAVEPPYIYWSAFSQSKIRRVGLDGSGENDSFVGANGPFQMAADGSHLYWSNAGGNVGRANIGDGSGETDDLITGGGVTGVAVLSTPGPPTGVSAVEQPEGASVAFDTPPANGTPITKYTVTSSPGGKTATGTASPVAITGLTDGTSYTFTVTATNAVGDGSASAPSNSVIPSAAPHITSFSPTSGFVFQHVTITGTGLANATVDFTGASAHAIKVSNTATSIVVFVPGDATLGPITVHTASGVATTATSFKPIPLVNINPTNWDGKAGNTILIIGANFTGATSVKFGTASASFTVLSPDALNATVPGGTFSSGLVSVTTPGGTGISSFPFQITKVTSIAPTSAPAGATVTITGQGLASTNGVDFAGHLNVTPISATQTAVKVVVPGDADVGPLTVHTPNIAGAGIATGTFKPLPKITSISPVDGLIGQEVVITGTNLDGANDVKFGSAHTSLTPTSATEVDATVPPNFSTGVVSVTTPGGTAVSTQVFQITKVTGISPAAAPAGATVTITGQGLGSVNAIDFGGHPGVVPTSATASMVKVVVPNDAISGFLTVHTANIGLATIPTPTLKVIPSVTSFAPADGMAGIPITITGANFTGATVVKFGTVNDPAFSVMSPTTINTTVPAGFSIAAISVTTPGGTGVSKPTFAITKVTAITPLLAVAGATITITGQGLGSATGVTFAGFPIPAPVVGTPTATSIKVIVPPFASAGAVTVHTPNVGIGGITTTQVFKPLPSISALIPTKADMPLLVSGSGFEPTGAPPTVTLGSTTLLPAIPNNTGFLIFVPANAVTSTLTVTTPEGTATAKLLVPPTINLGPTPSSGTVGTAVTVGGLTFTGTTSVTVGGVSTPFTLTGALGSTQTLSFKIPTNAVSGPIAVTNAGGTTSTVGDFDVTPVISSFSPTSAADDSTVTVKGTGFGGADLVTFAGGVTAVPTNVTATSLIVTVPQGSTSGAITVHTPTGGTSAASSASFTATETVSGLSVGGGAAGTHVTITGSGFTDVTDVKFGSTSAGLGNWTVVSPTQIVAVVPVGASDGVVRVVRSSSPTQLTSVATFEVVTVTSMSSPSVHVGDTLKFFGTHLNHTLTVGGIASFGIHPSFVADDGSEVDIVIPDGVFTSTPNLELSDFGTVTAPETLTILPPQITGVDGITNDTTNGTLEFTVHGAGFVGVTVKVGGAGLPGDADVQIPNSTEIDVSVPLSDNMAGGVVSVTTDEGTGSGDFVVYRHTFGLSPGVYYGSDAPASYTEADADQILLLLGAAEADIGLTTCGGDNETVAWATISGTTYTVFYGSGAEQGNIAVGNDCANPVAIHNWN